MSGTTKLYKVNTAGDCFEPGLSKNGEQVLIGSCSDDVVAVFFNSGGRLLWYEAKPKESVLYPDKELETWKATIGLAPGAVRIQEFFLEDHYIGITELPKCFREFVNDPSFIPTDSERQEWEADVRKWRQNGQFILCWGREFWMNADGLITST
jgi:hypothetical protein